HAMREAGATMPDPHEWAPSPAWPEGRGVFLLRPLLGVRRAAIREWLEGRGERWIDDPANEDPRFARARARRQAPGSPTCTATASQPLLLALEVSEKAGVLEVPRVALQS